MRRMIGGLALFGAVIVVVLTAWRASSGRAGIGGPRAVKQAAPATVLPVTHVYLFSSGVGYFQREGEIEGNGRVDLAFPASDVNDLLKSLVLQDMGGGKINVVGYDSHDPIERTLKSFALDLTGNPTFGQLLNQARGEKVEVVLQSSSSTQPATLNGVILGMEAQRHEVAGGHAGTEVDFLNLLCAEGARSVPLKDVQRVRFLNPVLEAELRRALEVLAGAHDSQKKTLSIGFQGEGKRTVKVGYVVENPIWKSSYRLVLTKDGKVHLQGWANVENTTDEDWTNVRMALVSGRPISFQMDLYQPLYVPRPNVEPELFASLRPPAPEGAILQQADLPQPQGGAAGVGFGGGLGGFGGGGLGGMGIGGAGGLQGGVPTGNRYQGALRGSSSTDSSNKITWDELQRRRAEQQQAKGNAKKVGNALAALDPTETVGSLPNAEEVGDYFRYVIDDKVTLPRQKSAMLAVVNQAVEGKRVSVYNQAVQAKFPLLGLKFRNLTEQPLMQGPVTVYEEGTYAGDARLPDLQPKEERLITYAIDQGTEVKTDDKTPTRELVAIKVVKGVIHASRKLQECRIYTIKNRSKQDRTLILEHSVRSDWKLKAPAKPMEQTRDHYRFQLSVPTGKTVVREVVEEQNHVDDIALVDADETSVRLLISKGVTSPQAREGLKTLLDLRAKLATASAELAVQEKQLKAVTDDQARLRGNLEKLPKESAAYKRSVEKFDKQETEIEKLQEQIAKAQTALQARQKEFDDHVMKADW